MASFHFDHHQTTYQYKKHIVDGIYTDYHFFNVKVLIKIDKNNRLYENNKIKI